MNEKIFSHFIAERKLNIFRIIILCNKYNIFDTNILSRGYSSKFQGMGVHMTSNPHSVKWKFQGGGASKVKVPSVGSMDIFSGTTQ